MKNCLISKVSEGLGDVAAINFSFLNMFSLKMEKEQVNNNEDKDMNEQVLRNFHFFAPVFCVLEKSPLQKIKGVYLVGAKLVDNS